MIYCKIQRLKIRKLGKALDPNTDATGRAGSVYWFTGLVCKSKADKGHNQCQSQTFKQIQKGWGTTTKSKTTSKNIRSTRKRQEPGSAGACSNLMTMGGKAGASQKEGETVWHSWNTRRKTWQDMKTRDKTNISDSMLKSTLMYHKIILCLSCCPDRTTCWQKVSWAQRNRSVFNVFTKFN